MVSLGIVSAVAMALTSCGGDSNDEPDLRCVDTQTYKTVTDSLCDSEPGEGYAATDRYQWYEDDGHSGSRHRYTGPRISKGGFGGHGSGSGS
jgi:hypothetical protein